MYRYKFKSNLFFLFKNVCMDPPRCVPSFKSLAQVKIKKEQQEEEEEEEEQEQVDSMGIIGLSNKLFRETRKNQENFLAVNSFMERDSSSQAV